MGFSLQWIPLVVEQGLGCKGSVTMAHVFSCSKACGIYLDQGSNPFPCIGRSIVTHWTPPLPQVSPWVYCCLGLKMDASDWHRRSHISTGNHSTQPSAANTARFLTTQLIVSIIKSICPTSIYWEIFLCHNFVLGLKYTAVSNGIQLLRPHSQQVLTWMWKHLEINKAWLRRKRLLLL